MHVPELPAAGSDWAAAVPFRGRHEPEEVEGYGPYNAIDALSGQAGYTDASSACRTFLLRKGTACKTSSSALPTLIGSKEAHMVDLSCRVNEANVTARVEPWVTLLDLLREGLGLTGTKKGCNHGACGACTVLVDGRRVLSCLTLAVTCRDRRVLTIEGLGSAESAHPMQDAFARHDALQCGYCTPGQIMSAVGMLAEAESGMPSAASNVTCRFEGRAALTDAEIRERLSGNICRCAAYQNIVAAVREVSSMRSSGEERTISEPELTEVR